MSQYRLVLWVQPTLIFCKIRGHPKSMYALIRLYFIHPPPLYAS